jgi:hypothetical protein
MLILAWLQIAASGTAIMIGTGDIGRCDLPGAAATASVVDSVLRAARGTKVQAVAVTFGDNAYQIGSTRDFAQCFGSTWGDTTKLIMRSIRPAPGNHEYVSEGAAPYFQYFGSRAGPEGRGYYSYDVGPWHAVVLNSEIVVSVRFSDAQRKAQEDWLRADLRAHPARCTVAYWHHPRFSSGMHGTDARLEPVWQILYDGGADLVLSGHDHNYERFLPQTPQGTVDSTRGITEIVVGTGGGDLRDFHASPEPHSEFRLQDRYGVLMLTLTAGGWTSAFLDGNHAVLDPSGGICH